jgi:hypothetical protein
MILTSIQLNLTFDILNNTFDRKYKLGRDLMVDESMVGFKGRTNLVQYMPGKKSHRCGAKLFVLAETSRSCLCIVVTMKKSRNILKSVSAKH